MGKLFKKLAVLLMVFSLAVAAAGCFFQDETESISAEGDTSVSTEESMAVETDTSETDNEETDNTETDQAETEDSSEDEDRNSGSMEVQDNLEIEIGEGEEGAW